MKVGIDSISFYVPSIYLDIETLANERNIEPAKLQNGLGLQQMALPDVDEDTATMAANALLKLIEQNNIDPTQVDRIYLGTESALDAAKPTATFAVGMVEKLLESKFGERCFKNCDVVDMTFACIGGVDVLHNCLDFIRANPHKNAIVISSDYAKYELNSGGEYTQGAGALAMHIKANPAIIWFENYWGVGFEDVYDFFKPRRYHDKNFLAQPDSFSDDIVEIYKDEPVFEGQYSNQCYQDRIREGYFHLKEQKQEEGIMFDHWENVIFHLPYAFHGKRIFAEIYGIENNLDLSDLRALSKSDDYKAFVNQKIESSQRASSAIGNMYSASIFMALLSTLEVALQDDVDLEDKKLGFLAYGSGSKAKVFAGIVQPEWKEKIASVKLFEDLNQRIEISFEQYEKLHRKQLKAPLNPASKGFKLERMETEDPNLLGARYYSYKK